jgi:hypothetical protein
MPAKTQSAMKREKARKNQAAIAAQKAKFEREATEAARLAASEAARLAAEDARIALEAEELRKYEEAEPTNSAWLQGGLDREKEKRNKVSLKGRLLMVGLHPSNLRRFGLLRGICARLLRPITTQRFSLLVFRLVFRLALWRASGVLGMG